MNTDADRLVERLRPTDFETFYNASWQEVFRPLAVTLGNADLAQEAVDEAMVRALARWGRVRSMNNREGWVYRVAYRWAIDRLRRGSRESRLLPRLRSQPSDPDQWVEPGLDAALAKLPIEQRTVVVLSVVMDWSESDIAAALSIRPGTVKSRLHRGLDKLRKELGT